MNEANTSPGILFVVSAPSGTGKSTVARAVVERMKGIEFSVSFTTRARRDGEVDGRDYHFIDQTDFERMRDAGEFLEWAPVFGGHYGTGKQATRDVLAAGGDVMLEIDVQGAEQVRDGAIACVSIMLLPPDFDTLRGRLEGRKTEQKPQVDQRLAMARREADAYRHFDYLLVNDDLETTIDEMIAIVRAERRRTARCSDTAEVVLGTFPTASAGS